jgi:hypothetical protein
MKLGVMPYEGGFLDQPAILMELLSMVQSLLHKHEMAEMKKQAAKNKSKR